MISLSTIYSFARSYQKVIRILALFIVAVLFSAYISSKWDQFARLKNLNFFQALLITFGQLLILGSSAFMLSHIALATNKRLRVGEAFKVTSYSALVNFFGFLQGGVGVRGLYLKFRLKIPLKRFFYFTVVQYVTLFFISFILIVVGSVYINGYSLLALLILLIAATVALLIENPLKRLSVAKPLSNIGIRGFLFINLIQIIGCLVSYGIELSVIGADFSLAALLIYTGVTQFAIVLAITPGALGIKEGLLLLAAGQMNLTLDEIILSSTLDRLLLFVTYLIILPFAIAARQQLPNIKSAEASKEPQAVQGRI